MKKAKDIEAATLAALEKIFNERKLPNPPPYAAEQGLADLFNALKARLPSAMKSGDPGALGRAIEDAALTALVARKTREEFDWKPHAIRAADQIRREQKAKKPALSVIKVSELVAEALELQGIRGRGGKLLTADTIKRELLRERGFKKI